jgi:hypothetical protein
MTTFIQKGQISDVDVGSQTGPYRAVRLNPATHGLITIDHGHHETHQGKHFTYTGTYTSIAAAASKRYAITTPNTTTWAHMLLGFYTSGGPATIDFYENPTFSGASIGTGVTEYNMNRNNTTTNTTPVWQ